MTTRSEKQYQNEKQAKLHSKTAFHCKTFDIRADTFHLDGQDKTWNIVVHPGAVVIVPVNHDGKLILVKQWRRAANQILIELPAGTLEPPEAPIVCAQRELQEEIGFKAHKITPLGGFFSAPGFCNEYLHLFLAEELEASVLSADDDEFIDLVVVSLDEALDMIDDHRICDSKTVAGILRYKRIMEK